MARIYLDTNIFSNLKSNTSDKFQKLNKYIELYKNNVDFFFSHAHVRDKKKDKTDIKFEDFDFMEKIVGDNYISYHALDKNTSFYLATPKMVYDDEDLSDDTDMLINFWEPKETDDPIFALIKPLIKKAFSSVQVPIDLKWDTLSEKDKELIKKMIPVHDDGQIDFAEFLPHFTKYQYQILTDGGAYKELRSLIDKSINAGKYTTVNGDFDFNEGFKNSAFEKTFFEYIYESCKTNGKEEVLDYDFYLKAYATLDSLGISKDKINKKNTFDNMFNDALHSLYARYFDYFVTDDSQTIQKSKALYNLTNVVTKVITSEEFLDLIEKIGKPTEGHLIDFFGKLSKDINDIAVIDSKEIDEGIISQKLLEHEYMNTFDELLELKNDEGRHFYLAKSQKFRLWQPNFRETGQIVNRCILLFGPDAGQFGQFDFEKEHKEIDQGNWKGRFWQIGTLAVYLHMNEGLKKLCLWISPIPS